jgi:hypothetical protein
MKKQILEELRDIKYLFNYNRGKIISEQEQFESEDDENINNYHNSEDINYLKELEEEIDFEVPTMEPGTKEKERIITKPGTKPDKDSPYSPKPGPKKNPKARKGNMPDWLSFDELGIKFN